MKKLIQIKGEGSITTVKPGRTYRIRLRIPPKTNNGKAAWSPMRTVHGTKTEARQEIEIYRKELERKLNNNNTDLTVAEWADIWQRRRRDLNLLSPNTINRDEIEIKRIKESFGSTLLKELTATDIKDKYAELRKNKLTESSLYKFHAKLKQILDAAVKEDKIQQNPCWSIDNIKRPAAKEAKSLTLEQALKLAEDLKKSTRNGKIVAVWLALATGVRRGEALGLIWENIDLKDRIIHIEKQLDSRSTRRKTKSIGSVRDLAIDHGTVLFLIEWKKSISKLFYKGLEVPPNSPVCTNEFGDFIEPNTFDRWRRRYFVLHGLGKFKDERKWTDKNGITRTRYIGYEGFKLHELRHTQATLLIGEGVDIKTVQKRLGHKDVSLTLNIYAHAIAEKDRGAANVIDNLFDKS
jgi:integrase